MCSHITIGLYAPVKETKTIVYPIGMINGEYNWGSRIEIIHKCPVCNEIITDKKYILATEEK
jgi:hypothetical protein